MPAVALGGPIDSLFRVETNHAATWEAVTAEQAAALKSVLAVYGESFVSAEMALKAGPDSEIFRISTGKSRMVARAAPLSAASIVESQARAAALLDYAHFLVPQSVGAEYTLRWNGKVWCIYPYLPGSSDWHPLRAPELVASAAQLLAAFSTLSENQSLRAIPRVSHDPIAWSGLEDLLRAIENRHSSTASISPETRELVERNRALFQASFQKAAADFAKLSPPRLTHNDLQQSNILVHQGKATFLDLEDIAFEAPEIAAAHCTFKLLRHARYKGGTEEEMKADLGLCLGPMRQYLGEPRVSALSSSIIRTTSDLWKIWSLAQSGDSRYLYDLEKKLHNLLEAHLVFQTEGNQPWTCN